MFEWLLPSHKKIKEWIIPTVEYTVKETLEHEFSSFGNANYVLIETIANTFEKLALEPKYASIKDKLLVDADRMRKSLENHPARPRQGKNFS